ncbi:MAG: SWIM zinc finger family protein [Alphaproteobacteria bacterium]|nr:SWIM zinc finger family protein [Alphaproteobacteria bacterium]
MNYFGWHPYVPVAEKRRQAERKLAKLRKQGHSVAPVRIEGRTIAKSFWGKSWCTNLERYSDYANRVPRGRTYVRNGSVVDLQIAKGKVTAMVAGSSLYKINITITPAAAARWKAICRDCAGTIDSLVELLQGRLAKGVMDRVCREGDGLFPSSEEIKLSCSCPDWADMCKHVAAALYGVGARLDEKPQLLFVLRGVDENELLAHAGQDLSLTRATSSAAKVLDHGDVAALFGLEMAETANSDTLTAIAPKRLRSAKMLRESTTPAVKKTAAAKTSITSRTTQPKSEPKWATLARARKRRAQRRNIQRSA